PGRRSALRVRRGAGDTGPRRRRRPLSPVGQRGVASASPLFAPPREGEALSTPVLHSGRGPLAQLVEQGTFNPKVAGSIPARPIGLSRPGALHVRVLCRKRDARTSHA